MLIFNFAKLLNNSKPRRNYNKSLDGQTGNKPETTTKSSEMAKETERKFLVTDDSYKSLATSACHIIQGYISRRKEGTVRVRIKDDKAYLTVKGTTEGITRNEWEYEIPAKDAREMLSHSCEGACLSKIRHIVPYNGFIWEVDEFLGTLAPLVIAEVELPSSCTRPPLPPFIGQEVSGNPAYYNSNLQG